MHYLINIYFILCQGDTGDNGQKGEKGMQGTMTGKKVRGIILLTKSSRQYIFMVYHFTPTALQLLKSLVHEETKGTWGSQEYKG